MHMNGTIQKKVHMNIEVEGVGKFYGSPRVALTVRGYELVEFLLPG